jgi:hypothetical protein
MKDYAEIEAYIAEARRLRSEAVAKYLSAGWHALGRGLVKLARLLLSLAHPRPKQSRRAGPYLPV